ncbi:sugar-transfer associated ATP-grasp domain-containing protein [Cecembia lonarensis]|uniref:Uncharacterized protein n=1 Tax=Cecembia lonarensis (strain CCUG 58316 / KCTC 22772 / LW9) TaxID=1225176 RepID=K1L5I4_CECL9|nr:sugar-transfer associated ATP-grasp domain-containing protein [Cecembia lonarensis]EKB47267.1 hypothetical protein B879_04137 [Cecembia lonarensis LW9]
MLKFFEKAFDRTVFFIQDLFRLDWKASDRFFYYTMKETGMKSTGLWMDIMTAVYMYQVSILEYYHYRFFDLDYQERDNWLGKGQIRMFEKKNAQAKILSKKKKLALAERFPTLPRHRVFQLSELQELQPMDFPECLGQGKKLLFKPQKTTRERGCMVRFSKDFSGLDMLDYMHLSGFKSVEVWLEQPEALVKVSAFGLHRVQVLTRFDANEGLGIVACRWLIPLNQWGESRDLDFLVAPVTADSGKVSGPAVSMDITLGDCAWHPWTGADIEGFEFPDWEAVIGLVKRAAAESENASFWTWELVFTKEGPLLYRAEASIDALVWQLPVKQGLKAKFQEWVK